MAKKELRWVAPDGWPSPPQGWSPPPGWQPDPSWPPAPEGWQWWQLTDRTAATNRHEAPSRCTTSIDEALVSKLNAASQTLTDELKTGTKEVSSLRAAVAAAAKPKKLLAIGSVKRVVLYETEVKLYGQLVPLSPSLHATAMTSGTKRDRTFRQDEDRRELTLTVDWPGGSRTVHWERNEKSVFGAMVEPSGLHNMAAAINTAAVQSPEVKSRLAAASVSHKQALSAGSTRARGALESALRALLEARDALEEALAPLVPDVEKGLSRAERARIKTARRALRTAAELESKVVTFLQSLDAASGHVTLEKPGSATPELVKPSQEAPNDGPEGPDDATAISKVKDGPKSDIDLLERLARLHEQGALSTEEFEAKKAEILGRL